MNKKYLILSAILLIVSGLSLYTILPPEALKTLIFAALCVFALFGAISTFIAAIDN